MSQSASVAALEGAERYFQIGQPASAAALEWAERYFLWCRDCGFTTRIRPQDLLDPENVTPDTVSPFFDVGIYTSMQVQKMRGHWNPYLHYFETGWRGLPIISPLVDLLFLGRRGSLPSRSVPLLLQVIEWIDSDDRFTCHPLFDPAIHRRYRPRKGAPALLEFIREPVSTPFSDFVEIDMMLEELATRNLGARNALLLYFESPLGTDINPMFFSRWYAERCGRNFTDLPLGRDVLSDYVLIGSRNGIFPNPYAMRTSNIRLASGDPAAFLDLIRIERYQPAGAVC